MAVDTTAASACYRENRDTLMATVLTGGKTDPMFRKMTGVKSHEFLHILGTDVKLGDCGCGCDGDDATHTFTDREITVGCIKVEDKVCKTDFDKMYLEAEIRIAASQGDIGQAGTLIAESFAQALAIVNEKAVWQGDTASEDENLNKFDGLVKILNNDSDVSKQTITAAEFSADPNAALAKLESFIPDSALYRGENTPEGALPFIAVPNDIFRVLRRALSMETAASCCKFSSEKWNGLDTFILNDTDIRVISVAALNGTSKIVEGSMHDLYKGMDGEGDADDIIGWWSQDCNAWRQRVEYKLGTQIAFPEDLVLVTITE